MTRIKGTAITLVAAAFVAGFVLAMSTLAPNSATAGATERADANVTRIYKTDTQWPLRGAGTIDPCKFAQCVEA